MNLWLYLIKLIRNFKLLQLEVNRKNSVSLVTKTQQNSGTKYENIQPRCKNARQRKTKGKDNLIRTSNRNFLR